MSFVFSSFAVAPAPRMVFRRGGVIPSSFAVHSKFSTVISRNIKLPWSKPLSATRRIAANLQSFNDESTLSLDWEDDEDLEEMSMPWEGAIVYKRNPSITHVEYCTTLERLGLSRLSSNTSKSRASVMGLRVTKSVKDHPDGTPVQISVDVIRKKKKLRLDGIVRTVITLGCNRCGEPAAESIFSNFSLLLSEEAIVEPEVIDLGFSFGKDKAKSFSLDADEDEDDDSSIDWDDRLHFPPDAKEIDISKHVRDLVHLEITINSICDPGCKGMCLKCGQNLNKGKCNCDKEVVKEKGYGPLGNLRSQMQQGRA